MSHFTVAVFTSVDQDMDTLLEPFYEGLEVEPYVSMTQDDIITEERNKMQRIYKNQYVEWSKDKAAYKSRNNTEHIKYLETLPERMKRSDEEIYQDVISWYNENDVDEDGSVLSTYNPDSKWDWYEIGGRWQGMLMLKPGKTGERGNPGIGVKMTQHYDSAHANDVDFAKMRRDQIRHLVPYAHALKNGYYSEKYMRQKYPTEQEYIQQNSGFSTYAVITPDGEWHAPGDMGWFAMSSETADERRMWEDDYYDRFIKPAITYNWRITIVDCHI